LNAEIYDRFGPLPPVAQNLLKLAKLKLAARAIGIRRMDLGAGGGTITFEERNSLDPMIVVKMIQKSPQVYRLEGSLKLRIARHMPAEEARFEFAGDLMKRLAGKAPAADEPTGGKPNPAAPTKGAPPKDGSPRRR
jgi:transcription-repair coupling factor (superfamily II helicase)